MEFEGARIALTDQNRFENAITTQCADIVGKQQRRVRISDLAVECYKNSIHHAMKRRPHRPAATGYGLIAAKRAAGRARRNRVRAFA
ncbi:hypothetical protein FMUAM8_05930 [Nocardia cyriacigeorgica]|nr:hypothetical protein FMUAM8_05930 [Nocardia cyriacigeorgica]BDU04332.1 hypothetical protein FMUBM48_05950 [Nocardia cyriacigeorgica]